MNDEVLTICTEISKFSVSLPYIDSIFWEKETETFETVLVLILPSRFSSYLANV